ncbi:hypothetical protein [Croceibacterium aestuarii]|uniref:hypothetical protein n=1 Tax=Croceibacterium aestuarii TaxID=3064139 RepID=UPI00272EACCF|nr:hypothetical protein [Croceibacterium sp. D39]
MPQQPPHDENGNVMPHDHDEIEDEDFVIRRISELQLCRDKDGRRRISSKAYQGSSEAGGGMSVDIRKFIEADDIEPRDWVTSPRWLGSVRFSAGCLRSLELQVGYDPLPNKLSEERNPYHGGVWGSFSRATKRRMQQNAQWFVPIADAELF